jgi:hypothetical protein
MAHERLVDTVHRVTLVFAKVERLAVGPSALVDESVPVNT